MTFPSHPVHRQGGFVRKLTTLFAIAVLAFGAVACSDEEPTVGADATDDATGIYSEGTPGAPAAEDDTIDAQITIVDFAFEPDDFTATAGEPVKWKNTGDAPHTVTFEDDSVQSSGNLEAGAEFSSTFEDAGEFTYFCSVHGKDRMSGTVTVQ
jgi:plastocyanin